MNANRYSIEIVSLTRVFGGGEIYIDRLLQLLGNRFMFSVVSPRLTQLQASLGKRHIEAAWLSAASAWRAHLGLAGHWLRHIFRRSRPSAVLLNGRGAAYWAPAYKLIRIPVVIVRHTELRGGLGERAYELCARSADRIVAVSRVVAAQHPPPLASKVQVIANWLSFPKADACLSTKSPRPLTLMFIGRLVPEKGLRTAVTAVQASDGARLDVYGEGPLEDWLREICESDSRLRWHGFVADMRAPLAAPGVLVQASESEAFSLTVAEAVSAGHLAIVSDICSHREILPPQYPESLFFKPGDDQSLRAAIRSVQQTLEHEPDILEQAWTYAAQHVGSLTDSSQALEAYSQLFIRLCQRTQHTASTP